MAEAESSKKEQLGCNRLQIRLFSLAVPLDKASQRILRLPTPKNFGVDCIAEIRKTVKEGHSAWDVPQVDVWREEDRSIKGPLGRIPLRIYWPAESGQTGELPVVVAYHGGGWAVGDVDLYNNFARYLCRYAPAIVVSVDYRLAPENKFPAAVEDAFAAVCWATENSQELGGDASKVCVAGDSAGGNLAAVVCHLAKQQGTSRIWKQLLFYPSVALTLDDSHYPSRGSYGTTEEFGLSNAMMAQFLSMYVNDESAHRDLRLNPILAKDFSGLPPALIIVAEYDLLRDEGAHYARRLQEADVPTVLSCYSGVLHGFMSQSGMVGVGLEALNEAAAYIRDPTPR